MIDADYVGGGVGGGGCVGGGGKGMGFAQAQALTPSPCFVSVASSGGVC